MLNCEDQTERQTAYDIYPVLNESPSLWTVVVDLDLDGDDIGGVVPDGVVLFDVKLSAENIARRIKPANPIPTQ